MTDYRGITDLAEAAKPWKNTYCEWPDTVGGRAMATFKSVLTPDFVLGMIADYNQLSNGCSELRGLFADAAEQCCKAERERDQFKAAYNEWIDKMAWARTWNSPSELGKHIADVTKGRFEALKAQNDELVTALNEILRVTPMGVEAFGIAALVLGELGVSKEQPNA